MAQTKELPNLHIAMYPWLAMGHITAFLQLANKLAQKGQKISFFLPPKTQLKMASLNYHPNLITFIDVPVPHVDGLSEGAETTNDVPAHSFALVMTAMDLTRDTIDSYLARLKPDVIFLDFTHWLPGLARKYGVKSVYYLSTYLFSIAYHSSMTRNLPDGCTATEEDLKHPPPDFPAQGTGLSSHEARILKSSMELDFGGLSLVERSTISLVACDAIAIKTCREMEGPFCEYVAKTLDKPLLLAGPVLPAKPGSRLDDDIDSWLKRFNHRSLVYCALGSECALEKDYFQELVLGLELTGRPFFAALRPPKNCETIESALPDGFLDRTKDHGIIHGGWVEQQLILHHPSVGCFVTHCGAGSLSEAMMSECQIVMLPQAVEQFINARLMGSYLRVGVEVEKRDSDGFFTRETVCKTINLVMEEESEVGKEVRANHTKWREILSKEDLENSYVAELVMSLNGLLSA